MSLLSQPGKPVWNYLVLMYKQGGKEEETGKRSRRSKQASCSHPSFKGDVYLMWLFNQSTVRLHKRFGEKSAQEDGVPWFKKVQISFFQCRLRLLKEERIKDYLLMEEEFISNQVDYYTQICPECCSDASMWSKPLLVEALLLSVDPKLKECPGTVETPGGEKWRGANQGQFCWHAIWSRLQSSTNWD